MYGNFIILIKYIYSNLNCETLKAFFVIVRQGYLLYPSICHFAKNPHLCSKAKKIDNN